MTAHVTHELAIAPGRTTLARYAPRPNSGPAKRAVAAGRTVQVAVGAGPGRVGRCHRLTAAEARVLAAELLAAAEEAARA